MKRTIPVEPLWIRIALGVVLLMGFRIFQYFPGFRPLEELYFGLSILAFIVLYPLFKMPVEWRFTSYELYVVVLLVVDPLLAGFSANQTFGQPMLYGILTERRLAILTTWLVLFCIIRRGLISIALMEWTLIRLAWINLAITTFMRVFLNPEDFKSAGVGLVQGGADGYYFQLQCAFMIFGAIYYVQRGFRDGRVKDYVIAVAMFLMSLGESGRTLSLCVCGTLLYLLSRWYSMMSYLLKVGKYASVIALAIGCVYLARPELVAQRFARYVQAFEVVGGAQYVEDYSANARIIETRKATPYIDDHYLLGNGQLSLQWDGGFERLFGGYFYPADIGLVGIIFCYGVLGLLLNLAQYYWAWTAARSVPVESQSLFFSTLLGCILVTLLGSIASGEFLWNAEISLFYIGLLQVMAAKVKQERRVPGLVVQVAG